MVNRFYYGMIIGKSPLWISSFWELHSFATNTQVSSENILTMANLEEHFHIPLSVQAFKQFNMLQQSLETIQIQENNDQWAYTCGNNYSSMRMYNTWMANNSIHDFFKLIWKSARQSKHKKIMWLLMHNRINTRSMLKKKLSFAQL